MQGIEKQQNTQKIEREIEEEAKQNFQEEEREQEGYRLMTIMKYAKRSKCTRYNRRV